MMAVTEATIFEHLLCVRLHRQEPVGLLFPGPEAREDSELGPKATPGQD